jgi:NADH:ubiquinone oxidoreductase subunit 5 (subunit L)/multisubunit Na+/H+ antiporter MnhA subunit
METYSGLLTPLEVHHELIQFAFQAVVLFLIAGQVIPQFRTTMVRLLGRVMTGFRDRLQQVPSLILGLFAVLDAVALVALVGYIFDSVISLSSIVSPSRTVSVSQAIAAADVDTPFNLLLTFYITGILLIVAFIGLRFLGTGRKEHSSAALLVEAFATPEVLAQSAALDPPPTEPPEAPEQSSPKTSL